MKKKIVKQVNNISKILLAFVLLIPTLFVPEQEVHAQTLRELKQELEEYEANYKENQSKQALTKEQMNQVQANINQIKKDMEQINVDVTNLTEEVAELEVNIKKKDKEIKDLVNFIQVSNGESAYLEYAFGAQDFTDFIYRMSVSEQLADYNEELIDSFNNMIKQNEQKKVELKEKKEQLSTKQTELDAELAKLGDELESLADTSVSIEEQIQAQKEIIEMYEDKGCDLDQDVASCGRGLLPSSTALYRPLAQGHVTSEWGYRDFLSGFHEGIDMTVRPDTYNIPVYSVGNGIVSTIMYRNSCGGNMVLVHHTINGQTYTLLYAHLISVNVSTGQYVTTGTQIGVMGGQSDTESYDKCTFGAHLHFTISTGLYGLDYGSWSTLISRSIDPRNLVNFPSGTYNEWYDRTTAY